MASRVVRAAVLGIAVGFGIAQFVLAVTNWTLVDMDAYWNAALRLRAGDPLYPPLTDATGADVYRYAPWFAYAWVPLTHAPKPLVSVVWSALLILASLGVVWRIARTGTPPAISLAGLTGGLLLLIDSTGNVHALLIAALVFGAARSSGPLWIAVAASLKVVPILYMLVFLGRREWRRAAITLLLGLVLVLPMLAFDLRLYPTDPGELSFSLFNRLPVAWFVLTTLAALATVLAATRRTPYAWLAASVAAVLALPRLWTYDFTFLAVGLAEDSEDEA